MLLVDAQVLPGPAASESNRTERILRTLLLENHRNSFGLLWQVGVFSTCLSFHGHGLKKMSSTAERQGYLFLCADTFFSFLREQTPKQSEATSCIINVEDNHPTSPVISSNRSLPCQKQCILSLVSEHFPFQTEFRRWPFPRKEKGPRRQAVFCRRRWRNSGRRRWMRLERWVYSKLERHIAIQDLQMDARSRLPQSKWYRRRFSANLQYNLFEQVIYDFIELLLADLFQPVATHSEEWFLDTSPGGVCLYAWGQPSLHPFFYLLFSVICFLVVVSRRRTYSLGLLDVVVAIAGTITITSSSA